jgi:hypothetical protein
MWGRGDLNPPHSGDIPRNCPFFFGFRIAWRKEIMV